MGIERATFYAIDVRALIKYIIKLIPNFGIDIFDMKVMIAVYDETYVQLMAI